MTPSIETGSTSPLTAAEARSAAPKVSGGGGVRRVDELELARILLVQGDAHVGCEDDELDLGGDERRSEILRAAQSFGDRARQGVVVQAAGELPEPPRPEDLVGLQVQDEDFEVVQPVEGGHRS